MPVAQKGPFEVKLPCGNGFTVMVADAAVMELVRTHVLASVIDVSVYAVVLAGFGFALKGVPLTTPE